LLPSIAAAMRKLGRMPDQVSFVDQLNMCSHYYYPQQ
jgi:hypothetical protein